MILFLESVAGIAGDMFAASFVDAGVVSAEELQGIPRLLGLDGVLVEVSKVFKATTRVTHIDVKWDNENWKKAIASEHTHEGAFKPAHGHSHVLNPKAVEHWHTHYLDLDRFLAKSALEPAVQAFARKVFRLLAEAEASAHGTTLEDVAFHEVGAVDSIVDVAMAAYCVNKVGASQVLATPVKLGRGTISIEHGSHPVPPPASARLAVGFPVAEVPSAISRPNVELSTPTGLAILKALAPKFVAGVPAGVIKSQGAGGGTMDLGAYPNVFRVMVLEEARAAVEGLPYETDEVIELCCNMDDETAERTAWVMEHLMLLGALDVWVTPVTGKKGRAAVCLSVLAETAKWKELADWLLRHSSTFGLRHRKWDRLKLARRFEKRATAQGTVAFKVGMTTDGQVLKEKPEFEDVRKLWDRDPGFKP